MANNQDDNWFVDFTVGQMTGQGSGVYGEMGNQLHREEKKRNEARQKADFEYWQNAETPQVSTPDYNSVPVHNGNTVSKPWSNVLATFGFLGGAGAMYAQPEPSLAAAIIVGLITAFIFGRFYKFIFVSAVVLFILWLLF